jgi:integrase
MAGQIIKRGDSIWLCRVFLGRNGAGKRQYLNHTVHGTKKDAQQWLTATLRNQDVGMAVAVSSKSVASFLNQWLENAKKGSLKTKTFNDYRDLLERHITPRVGRISLGKLTTLDLQGVYNQMKVDGLSPRTIQYTHMILGQALKQAVIWKLLTFNPNSGVELPRQEHREMQVLNPEQSRRLLAVATLDDEGHWGALFSLALTTGMRPTEYLALKWADLDLEKKVVSVKRSVAFAPDGTWVFSDLKTKRSRRIIKLQSNVTATLKKHKVTQEQRRRNSKDWVHHDLVFSTRMGTPIERNNLKRVLRRLIDKANEDVEAEDRKLPYIRLYDLRHTCATLGLSAGVSVKVIAEMLGHANIALTLNVYSHVLPHMQDDAAERMEALLTDSGRAKTGSWHTIGTQSAQASSGR